jgi:hypothetical protein
LLAVEGQEDLLVLVDEALPDGLAVVGERGVVLRVARLVRVHVVVVGGSDDLVRGEDDRQAGVFLDEPTTPATGVRRLESTCSLSSSPSKLTFSL